MENSKIRRGFVETVFGRIGRSRFAEPPPPPPPPPLRRKSPLLFTSIRPVSPSPSSPPSHPILHKGFRTINYSNVKSPLPPSPSPPLPSLPVVQPWSKLFAGIVSVLFRNRFLPASVMEEYRWISTPFRSFGSIRNHDERAKRGGRKGAEGRMISGTAC